MTLQWGRLLTAIITPYDKDGDVDYKRASLLADQLIRNGSDGVVVAGTTGESPVLSIYEKEHLYSSIKEKIGSSGVVIAATGSNDTKKTVKDTLRAAELGVDGVMVVAPYYNKPSQNGLFQHFYKVAESSKLPIMIYNIPSRTGVYITPETIWRLAELPTISAVKASTGNVLEITHIRQMAKNLLIYSGDDSLTLPLLSVGAHGVVSVASHIASRPIKKMIDYYVTSQNEKALELHERLLPLFEALFVDGNPTSVKSALEIIGFSTGGLRLPLVSIENDKKNQIEKSLNEMADLLDVKTLN